MAVEWTTKGNREIKTRTGTSRRIYHCKTCRTTTTIDYAVTTTTQFVNGCQRGKPDTKYAGRYATLHFIPNIQCPTCKAFLAPKAVQGTKTEKPCDSRCMGAIGPMCFCSCGGANHGASHLH